VTTHRSGDAVIEIIREISEGSVVKARLCIFDDVFRTEYVPTIQLAYRYLQNSHSANDIAQEVFLKFWIHLEGGRIGHKNYVGWLRTVTANLCRDQIDWLKHRTHAQIEMVRESTKVCRSENAENLCQDVMEFTKLLPEQLQRPLLLTAVDGFNSRDAGKKVGISPAAIRKRCELARKTVIMMIRDESEPVTNPS